MADIGYIENSFNGFDFFKFGINCEEPDGAKVRVILIGQDFTMRKVYADVVEIPERITTLLGDGAALNSFRLRDYDAIYVIARIS